MTAEPPSCQATSMYVPRKFALYNSVLKTNDNIFKLILHSSVYKMIFRALFYNWHRQ